MALPLLVFALPGDEPGSARQLLAVVKQDHEVLKRYKENFSLGSDGQPHTTVESFENASGQINSLRKYLQSMSEQYRRYPRRQFSKILQDEQLKRLWSELTTGVDRFAIQLEKMRKGSYSSREIWLRLDDISIVYEDISSVLEKIYSHETQISIKRNG